MQETSKEMIKLFYSDAQKREIAQEMAIKVGELSNLNDRLSSIKKQFKTDIESAELIVKSNADKLRTGYYYDHVECHVLRDFHTKEVHLIRCDNCELIKSRDMRPEELQMTLDEVEKDNKDKNV